MPLIANRSSQEATWKNASERTSTQHSGVVRFVRQIFLALPVGCNGAKHGKELAYSRSYCRVLCVSCGSFNNLHIQRPRFNFCLTETGIRFPIARYIICTLRSMWQWYGRPSLEPLWIPIAFSLPDWLLCVDFGRKNGITETWLCLNLIFKYQYLEAD